MRNRRNLCDCQRRAGFLRRHPQIDVLVTNAKKQLAFVGLARNHDWTIFTPLAQPGRRVESQLGPLFFRTVALQTMPDQQRPHAGFEEVLIALRATNGRD
jgi:hypothetical protein